MTQLHYVPTHRGKRGSVKANTRKRLQQNGHRPERSHKHSRPRREQP